MIDSNQTVTSSEDLAAAIQSAKSGDTITLQNGIWNDIQLRFAGSGTADQPITLRAQTPGEVIFTGASTLTLSGEHLVVDGLYFKEGIQPGLDGTATIVRFLPESRFCRLTNTAIVDCKPLDRQKKYFWVTLEGSNHRIDNCYFKGKDYAGQLLRNIKYSRENRIDHNYFVDIPAYGLNGLEIIQVMGIGSDGEPGSAGGEYVVIEENLFERADGECEEIISLKSNHDIVRRNTFKDSIGGLVIRSGHNTVVEGNCFLGGNIGGTKGIRITGEDNVVVGNYLTGLQGFAISIMSGEYIDRALTDQWQPVLREGTPLGRVPIYNAAKYNTISGNVMVQNEGVDLDIGIGYKSGWPAKQRILLPEENELADNTIIKTHGAVVQIVEQDPTVVDIEFAPNGFHNNQVYSQRQEESLPEGFAVVDQVPDVQFPAIPLTDEQVGPEWVKQKRKAGEPLFQPRDQFATVEAVPWESDGKVWVLCAGSSDLFVQNKRTKLDVQKRHLCPIEQDGALLIPVRAVAEKLGLQVTSEFAEADIRVLHDEGYLPADQFAALFGKILIQDERGLAILTDKEEDAASFADQTLLDQTFALFQTAASSFAKYMTIPPLGHTHGQIPANTLNDDSALVWTAFGDGQWIRYDLGHNQEINCAEVSFGPEESVRYSFEIEVSVNGLDWTPAVNCQSSAQTIFAERFAWEPVTARYVRIVSHSNSVSNAIRIRRVQIYSTLGEALL